MFRPSLPFLRRALASWPKPSLFPFYLPYILFYPFIYICFAQGGGLMGNKLLNNPDLKPQHSTSTKFADVKGVDEAKHELEEVGGVCV